MHEIIEMLERLIYGIPEPNLVKAERHQYLQKCLKNALGVVDDNYLIFRSLNDCGSIHMKLEDWIKNNSGYIDSLQERIVKLETTIKNGGINYIAIGKFDTRIEKLELAIKNSPPNSDLLNRIKERNTVIDSLIGDLELCTDKFERIVKLEERFDTHSHHDSILNNFKEISKLKDQFLTMDEIDYNYNKQLSELKEDTNIWIQNYNQDLKELSDKVEGIYKSVHGIEPNEPDKIWKEIKELKEQFKNENGFPIKLPKLVDEYWKIQDVLREFISDFYFKHTDCVNMGKNQLKKLNNDGVGNRVNEHSTPEKGAIPPDPKPSKYSAEHEKMIEEYNEDGIRKEGEKSVLREDCIRSCRDVTEHDKLQNSEADSTPSNTCINCFYSDINHNLQPCAQCYIHSRWSEKPSCGHDVEKFYPKDEEEFEYGLTEKGLDAVNEIIIRSPQYVQLVNDIIYDLEDIPTNDDYETETFLNDLSDKWNKILDDITRTKE